MRSFHSLLLMSWLSVTHAGVVHAAAALGTSGESINLGADVVDSDPRNDSHVLSGNVKITQGPLSIEAQQATASALQSTASRWTFERDVHIQTADADLRSNSATAAFRNGQIAEALIKGTPAVFEQRRGTQDKVIRGRAGTIQYDFGKGLVRMSDQVSFTYDGNEFRGNTVVYNVRDERVIVNPDSANTNPAKPKGRVNITIQPKTGKAIAPSGSEGGSGGESGR